MLVNIFMLVRDIIHDSHEIAILEFPTSDCSQNEAWCHAKRTDVTVPIENTRRRPNQHCKFNALVARIDDHSIVFNYAVWARCYHTVLNWPAILSERFVWCLKMTFNTRYRWKRGAHARAVRRRVGCTQSHKIPHKISFCVNTAVSRKCDWNSVVLGSWHVARNDLNGYFVHLCAIQLTTAIDHLDNKTKRSPCIMSMV